MKLWILAEAEIRMLQKHGKMWKC